MMFQICNEPHGYVVEVHILDNDGICRWHPLRNFGERQGDARFFKEYDCPKLSDTIINALIRAYNPRDRYIRVNENRFKKEDAK